MVLSSCLQEVEADGELRDVPGWKVDCLPGDRKGIWSLTITHNWGLTFRTSWPEGHIFDLDYKTIIERETHDTPGTFGPSGMVCQNGHA